MLKRFLIGLGTLLVIVAVIFYYKMGGSQDLKFKKAILPAFYVVGNYFEGRYNDPEIKKLFFNAKERAEQEASAALTVINYGTNEDGTLVRQFIGSGSLQKPEHIPDHLELRSLPRHEAIFTEIVAHNVVMPTPEEVLEEAKLFAWEKDYKLDTLSYETYISDRELKVTFLLKK